MTETVAGHVLDRLREPPGPGTFLRGCIMEILESFDRTRWAHSAAALSGVDEQTVDRYVTIRDTGRDPFPPARRARLIEPFLGKIEERSRTPGAGSALMCCTSAW